MGMHIYEVLLSYCRTGPSCKNNYTLAMVRPSSTLNTPGQALNASNSVLTEPKVRQTSQLLNAFHRRNAIRPDIQQREARQCSQPLQLLGEV